MAAKAIALRPCERTPPPRIFTELGGELYFTAHDGNHGFELWRSDGTAAGIDLVRDIQRGAQSSSPGNVSGFGGELYFLADDGEHGEELWRSAAGFPAS